MKDIEFDEALVKFKIDIRSTKTMLIVFCIIALLVKFVLGIPIPVPVIFLIFIWFLLYFVYEHLMKKAKTSQAIYDLYFRYNIIDILFLTLIIHYLGSAAWIGAIFYVLVLVTAGVVIPKKKAIILGFTALVSYSCLVLFEYFEVIPNRPLFLLEPNIFQSQSYVVVQILVLAAVFYFIAETAGTFSEMLRTKTRELEKEKQRVVVACEEAEQARGILEVRVEARTKELKKLTKNLDEQVQERTKELQKKIKELQRFQKLVVGRELKMVELKKKLQSKQKRYEINKKNN